MGQKDADLATDFADRGLYVLDVETAELVPTLIDANEEPGVSLYVLDAGSFGGAEPGPPGPPVLSELDSELGGIGFGIRTTKARG